jgi:tyrosinase
MANLVTSTPIPTASLDAEFTRADIEFHGLDHSGATYEGRVFLNLPDADEQTSRDVPEYAGSYFIFGHGGCLGDPGHCDTKPRRFYDPRAEHPLTPTLKVVIATNAIRCAMAAAEHIAVTIVPILLATNSTVGEPDDLASYEHVRIVTYR